VDALSSGVDEYFAHCEANDKPYTVSGLAMWLDVETETLRNYEKRDEYFATIKRAKQRIENQLEEGLFGNNVTGLIFNLKNNFGWQDKSTTTHEGELSIKKTKVLQVVGVGTDTDPDTE
jgi:hypothetical protein